MPLKNVASLTFSANESSYLVGAAAALKSKTGQVGFIGGVDVPLIQSFQAGFDAGAKYVNPKIKIDDAYLTEPPDFGGFNEPDKAKDGGQGHVRQGCRRRLRRRRRLGCRRVPRGQGREQAGHRRRLRPVPHGRPGGEERHHHLGAQAASTPRSTYFLKDYASGKKDSGTQVFDLKNDGVGYSTSGGQIDDIKAKLDAIKAEIISGTITVPNKT